MKSQKTIELNASDVRTLINDIGLLVVSLDRIGAAYPNSPAKRARALGGYMDVEMYNKTTQTRAVLSKSYNSHSTKADVVSLEEEAEDLPYWQES